jgi:hypothetical protein
VRHGDAGRDDRQRSNGEKRGDDEPLHESSLGRRS